jgi:hypothetical protein
MQFIICVKIFVLFKANIALTIKQPSHIEIGIFDISRRSMFCFFKRDEEPGS